MPDENDPPVAPQKPYDGAAEGRTLLRTVRAGTLATLAPGGEPFASLVSVATAMDGSPILLVSRLAAHTSHLEADPRCSLLLARTGKGDPLAHPRLTVLGQACRIDRDVLAAARGRFLARHPKAALYVDFPDFSFWRIDILGGHLNGGFARAASLGRDDLVALLAGCEALAASEAGAVQHMNQDHRDALALYATVLAGAEPGTWRASSLDPDGIDLVCGDRVARANFPQRVTTSAELRSALVAMVADAHARASATSRA